MQESPYPYDLRQDSPPYGLLQAKKKNEFIRGKFRAELKSSGLT